jgi:hypothetical protein
MGAPFTAGSAEAGETVASFAQYEKAQKAVSALIAADIPAKEIAIVGQGLRSIERVTGRLTWSKVLSAGAWSGIGMGLFVGIVLSTFSDGSGLLETVAGCVLLGIVFAMIFAAAGYAATRGQRDFSSVQRVVATKYEVLVEHKFVNQGRELLTQLDPMRAAQAQVEEARRQEALARAEQQAQEARAANEASRQSPPSY